MSQSPRRAAPRRPFPVRQAATRHPVPRRSLAAGLLLLLALAPRGAAQELKTLALEDYGRWSRVTNVALAPDGRWLAYAYSPNDGDATLHVRALDGVTVHTAVNGASPAFSEDGRWVAFLTSPAESEQQRLRRERKPIPRALELIDLATGARTKQPDVQSFRFSADNRYLAVEKSRDASATHQGRDVIVVELASGSRRNIGNVSSFAFSEPGTLLAYTVDAANRAGNGLYVLDPATGYTRVLDTDTAHYERLSWNEAGTALAALRGATPAGQTLRANVLLAFTGLPTSPRSFAAATRVTRVAHDPQTDADFPAGMVLSELGAVSWSRDGARIFLGIREQQPQIRPNGAEEERTNVEIWHWADDRVQSVQKVQNAADGRYTYAGAVDLGTRRYVRFADDDMRSAAATRDGRWAIAQRDRPYRMLFDEPGGVRDLVRIDTRTGERATLVERVRFVMATSPDSRWQLWFRDGRLMAQEIATARTVDLSARADASFLNVEADRPGEKPSYGIGGWTRDGRALIANTKYDLWLLPLSGSGAGTNLTRGIGEREQIRFRVVNLGEEDSDEGVDTSKPLILSAYGDRTKKSGYWILEPGREPRPLIWEDRQIGQLRKAKNAERVVYTAQTFEEFPDWWVATSRFAEPRRVTDANPQQAEYRWGRRILVDFTDQRGNRLQATVTLPAGYVEGRRYPTLIYFYERLSQNHHTYSLPVYDDRPHFSTYASDGYLVVMPDIVYDDNRPGSSALDDVTSAARRVIELGLADPDRIGLQGHSWGGYQSSFIVTQTDMFAAVVTGAPLTNLESMHNILYRQSGNPNAALIQWGQGRMGTVPWVDVEGYARESPVRHVRNISTPFLIMHGTADGAVDWNQGLEFYIAARREGKNVILLSYPDEPHHLARKPNQIDFQRRMKEYFDHHLKGSPAPAWMTEGVPYRDRARELQERSAPVRANGGR
jgi:dipeptidyl aminopeptidase/acylaminoacyl peptidase